MKSAGIQKSNLWHKFVLGASVPTSQRELSECEECSSPVITCIHIKHSNTPDEEAGPGKTTAAKFPRKNMGTVAPLQFMVGFRYYFIPSSIPPINLHSRLCLAMLSLNNVFAPRNQRVSARDGVGHKNSGFACSSWLMGTYTQNKTEIFGCSKKGSRKVK